VSTQPTDTATLTLLANLGAEEGEAWRQAARLPAVARAKSLWGSLFGLGATIDDSPASPHAAPAFGWLPATGEAGVLAWWGDTAAARTPEVSGKTWLGSAPEVTEAIHDKAFALREGTLPSVLRDTVHCFDPDDLKQLDSGADAAEVLRAIVARWPAWLRDRGCLKPRLGSSGRGRFALGPDGVPHDLAALESALGRLAQRGGAILEPWLQRSIDLSVHFHAREPHDPTNPAAGPPLVLLGSLIALCTEAGVPRGHRGEIDHRGRIHCGTRHDDALRDAGSELALAAYEAGYRGPCGIDAFSFLDDQGSEVLRPTVELNARFTMGTVALGCLRRERKRLRKELRVQPEERAHVLVANQPPGGSWQNHGADVFIPIEILPRVAPDLGPAIVASRDPLQLDAIARRLVADSREARSL